MSSGNIPPSVPSFRHARLYRRYPIISSSRSVSVLKKRPDSCALNSGNVHEAPCSSLRAKTVESRNVGFLGVRGQVDIGLYVAMRGQTSHCNSRCCCLTDGHARWSTSSHRPDLQFLPMAEASFSPKLSDRYDQRSVIRDNRSMSSGPASYRRFCLRRAARKLEVTHRHS